MPARSKRAKTAHTPKTAPKTEARTPPQYAALLMMLKEYCGDEGRLALAAARAALRDVSDDEDVEKAAWQYIEDAAARGSLDDLHARLNAIASPPSETDPHWAGDYLNVYGTPALMIGVALAYVFLRENGGER